MVRDGHRGVLPLYSPRAFELLSEQWLRVGWAEKYPYAFSWLGRPVIQAPEDLIRIQEVVHVVKPDVLIETGVAHGGSLVFYASLFKAMGTGRVIGVDIEIRPHNRIAIEAHPLASAITLIEGSSIAADTVAQVRAALRDGDTVTAPAGAQVRCRASVGNLGEAAWLAPLAGQETGRVYLAGRKEYGLEFRSPIAADTPYLKDAAVREFLLILSLTAGETRASIEMEARGRAYFGERRTVTIKAGP